MELRHIILTGGPLVIAAGISYLNKFSMRDRLVDTRRSDPKMTRTVYEDTLYLALPLPLDMMYRLVRYKRFDLKK